ncbi:MAG TPA: S8/S53 family peptidase [Nannocystaceae bacterium]|nr:S8/S53 family peptidase [Nannocystaceae bacterium]
MRRHAIVAPLLCILVTSSVVSGEAAAAPPSKAPVARRYIAILKKNVKACPRVEGWKQQQALFDRKNYPSGSGPGFDALQRFCLYTEPVVAVEPSSPDFMRADPDYDVLVPQGSLAKDPEVREALNQIYRTMLDLGPLGSAKTQPLYDPTKSAKVAEVAVIDTTQDSTDRGIHGRAMAEIINEVRCPAREAKCRAHLSFYNAFPWISTTAALSGSSSEPLGSLGSLSQEIYRAVSQWRTAHPDGTTGAPLILNLSLAWDPGAGNKSPAWAPDDWKLPPWDIPPNQGDEALELNRQWPATVQAVHAALVYASCFDVLTIAAAGNSTRGAEVQTGALAPAKWEKLLAPTPETCRELFGVDSAKARRPGNGNIEVKRRPLVYAVRGRMTGIGNALPNSRKGSTSLQISPASHVVAGAGRSRTDPWSGSSVAAATYSGLAATLWSYDPRLTPHQVMALIYDTGEKSTLLYPGKVIRFNPVLLQGGTVEGPTDEVRATSPNPFGAFEALCPTGCGYGNPYTEVSADLYAKHREYEPLTLVLPNKIAAMDPPVVATGPKLEENVVAIGRRHFFPENTTPPLAEAADAKPWTRPQPQTPICPTCPVTGTTLTLSLTNVPDELKEGDKVILENPVLEFNLGDTQGFFAVSMGKIEVPPAGLRVSLDRYTIKVDGVEKGFGTAILESQVRAGTLTIFLKDSATGEVRTNVSIVPVLP